MRVSVLVLSDPDATRAGEFGLRLLWAAQTKGLELDTAFFYHKGAYAAVNRALDAPWAALSQASGLACIICRTALARVGADPSRPLPTPWRLGGLADWLAASARSDRVLVFGGGA